jgi:hypothetical protein
MKLFIIIVVLLRAVPAGWVVLRPFNQKVYLSPRLFVIFVTSLFFVEFLALCPTLKLEDHPLSTMCYCFFNIFTATLHIQRPSPYAT